MSKLFDVEATPQVPFEDPNKVKIEDLVGEDKKYKTQEDLVKALAHSQNHIANLEATHKRFETEAERMTRLEKLVEDLGQTNVPNSDPSATPAVASEEPAPTAPNPSQSVDFESLINEKFGALRAQEVADTNAGKVRETLVSSLGDSKQAQDFFTKRAQELNMSTDELDALASKNPDAALKLLDPPVKAAETAPRPSLFSRPPSDRLPDPNNPSTIEDFNALRKANFQKWCSPNVQRKINALIKE